MTWLLICTVLGIFAVFWWQASLGARDRANVAAREACERAGAQLLDGTVAFQRLRPTRDDDGRVAFRRTYVFDYSDDGHSRRQGFVVLRGTEVEVVGLGPVLVHRQSS